MSYSETHDEKQLGVARPQMAESRLDPDTYLPVPYGDDSPLDL